VAFELARVNAANRPTRRALAQLGAIAAAANDPAPVAMS
jgi:hypothetical protein